MGGKSVKISAINDYSCLHNKCSEFLFKALEPTEALAMRRENFNNMMEDPATSKLKVEIARVYRYVVQEPIHEHRDEMAQKFKNRIDYVNI